MKETTTSIAFGEESLQHFTSLLQDRAMPTGAHCGSEDGDDSEE